MVTESQINSAGRALARAASSTATVVLFGSHARGDAKEGSDVDFLVIEEGFDNKLEEMGRLRQAVPDLGAPVDVLVVSRSDAERCRHAAGSIVRHALAEGRVVVDAE